MRLPAEWFRSYAANDVNKDALAVLESAQPAPDHVFSGLLECLPEAHQHRIEAMRPPKRAKKHQAAACHKAQKEYMVAFQDDLFQPAARAQCCTLHPDDFCPLFWSPSGYNQGVQPLTMNFSGAMCTPWTSQGPQLGDADPAMESYHCWILKMKHSGLDFIMLENSDRFPFHYFADELTEAGYECFFVIFSAQDSLKSLFSSCSAVACELSWRRMPCVSR